MDLMKKKMNDACHPCGHSGTTTMLPLHFNQVTVTKSVAIDAMYKVQEGSSDLKKKMTGYNYWTPTFLPSWHALFEHPQSFTWFDGCDS